MFVRRLADNTRNARGHGGELMGTNSLPLSLLSSLCDFFVSLSGAHLTLLVIAAKPT